MEWPSIAWHSIIETQSSIKKGKRPFKRQSKCRFRNGNHVMMPKPAKWGWLQLDQALNHAHATVTPPLPFSNLRAWQGKPKRNQPPRRRYAQLGNNLRRPEIVNLIRSVPLCLCGKNPPPSLTPASFTSAKIWNTAGGETKEKRAFTSRHESIQVKQKDKVGRPDIDSFEAMMMCEDCERSSLKATQPEREIVPAFYFLTGC
jgi:hypothetical protein